MSLKRVASQSFWYSFVSHILKIDRILNVLSFFCQWRHTLPVSVLFGEHHKFCTFELVKKDADFTVKISQKSPTYKSTMSDPISIVTKNYGEIAAVREAQNIAQAENKTNREAATTPAANTIKAAQAMTDAVIASGKQLSQVVAENSDQSVKKMERMDVLNRDLEIAPVKSGIGTVADENALPSEINSRQSL